MLRFCYSKCFWSFGLREGWVLESVGGDWRLRFLGVISRGEMLIRLKIKGVGDPGFFWFVVCGFYALEA